MYEDKTLTCKTCGNEFVWTAGEQEFYAARGLQNEPKNCKPCRDAKKGAKQSDAKVYVGVCADCGGEAVVRFQPSEDRPIYCKPCYDKRK